MWYINARIQIDSIKTLTASSYRLFISKALSDHMLRVFSDFPVMSDPIRLYPEHLPSQNHLMYPITVLLNIQYFNQDNLMIVSPRQTVQTFLHLGEQSMPF